MLAAHGSHLNPNTAAPCYAAADAIRRRKLFAEVQESFWKQEPSFRLVLPMIESREVFVVPFFISDGYFTETVLPRELGVTQATSRLGGKIVHYGQPVGTHDSMTRVILHRADEIVQADGANPPRNGSAALFIAGHGTDKNENSAKSILRQVELIRERGRYAEVHAVFLDQEPRIERCFELSRCHNLIVVPFFISDGLHTQEDIPAMLGLQKRGAGYRAPSRVRGRSVYYCGAVGTDARMAEVVIARAEQAAN